MSKILSDIPHAFLQTFLNVQYGMPLDTPVNKCIIGLTLLTLRTNIYELNIILVLDPKLVIVAWERTYFEY